MSFHEDRPYRDPGDEPDRPYLTCPMCDKPLDHPVYDEDDATCPPCWDANFGWLAPGSPAPVACPAPASAPGGPAEDPSNPKEQQHEGREGDQDVLRERSARAQDQHGRAQGAGPGGAEGAGDAGVRGAGRGVRGVGPVENFGADESPERAGVSNPPVIGSNSPPGRAVPVAVMRSPGQPEEKAA